MKFVRIVAVFATILLGASLSAYAHEGHGIHVHDSSDKPDKVSREAEPAHSLVLTASQFAAALQDAPLPGLQASALLPVNFSYIAAMTMNEEFELEGCSKCSCYLQCYFPDEHTHSHRNMCGGPTGGNTCYNHTPVHLCMS
ncbi:MAG: hypothetical protein KF868_20045 [Acidobacteria bacterium]|nr:hypothetical protein [Acidobacteriota bacterium]MCW5971626.1 hypothetical protein [Blastocatellales bacterium]